jgi:translation initiation factor 2-alpha kinase 1
MWEESWVPKIGDFGLAAEVIDEGTGDAVLVPTPISSTPPSPKISPSFGNNANSPTAGQVISNNRPTRPKPQRTRTLGVGTRTVSGLSSVIVRMSYIDLLI